MPKRSPPPPWRWRLALPDADDPAHFTTAAGTPGFTVSIEGVDPVNSLRWRKHHPEPKGEIEVCVEDADGGTRITITRSRFGAIDDGNWQASHRG